MPKFEGSERIVDVLKNKSQKTCPVCGEDAPEKRMIGGVKNGKDEPFDERIICPNCGTDLTAEDNDKIMPLEKKECETIRRMQR